MNKKNSIFFNLQLPIYIKSFPFIVVSILYYTIIPSFLLISKAPMAFEIFKHLLSL